MGVEGEVTKGEKGWVWVKVKMLDNLLSIFTLYIFKCVNIAIKQMYKMCIYECLRVYILTLEWPCKIPEVYKTPRF